jgi:hypothetical protein
MHIRFIIGCGFINFVATRFFGFGIKIGCPVRLRGGVSIDPFRQITRLARHGQVRKVNVAARFVIRVERNAINRHALTHAHVNVLAIRAFDAAEQSPLGAEQVAGHARRDDHFNLGHTLQVENR